VGSSQVITLGDKEEVRVNAKFRGKLTFLPTCSLQNRLLESPFYIAYIISTTLGTLIGYSLLKFN